MVITASVLTLGVAVAIAGQVAKHRIHDPRLPFAVGLALTLIAPTFLMALVVEVILLFTWNPLNWCLRTSNPSELPNDDGGLEVGTSNCCWKYRCIKTI